MPRLTPPAAASRAARQLDGAAAPADFSEALARGLAVLQAFGDEPPGDAAQLSLADLARRLDLPRATVRRAVLTLQHLGFLTAHGRTYALTPEVLRLASAYLGSNLLSRVVQPACDEVADRLGAPCAVAVLDGADAVMVARALPRQLMPVGAGIGYRVPAAWSALGRVLLAARPVEEVDAVLSAGGADAATRRVLADRLAEVRDRGWAHVVDEAEPGHQSVAVALRRWDGEVVAAMNVGSSTQARTAAWMTGEALDCLTERAAALRALLV
ncbi:IclR family transcriptional regulator domain-containing protein [Blastococcus sp. SYSU D00820]